MYCPNCKKDVTPMISDSETREKLCPICGGELIEDITEKLGIVFTHYGNIGVGTKHDAGKPQVGDFIKDFGLPLTEVAKVWAFGAEKYTRSNWKIVENGEKRYTDALIRHLMAEENEEHDKESELKHAYHVAWNALARIYFIEKVLNK